MLPVCPTDCTSSAPSTPNNDCNVELNFGEVKTLFISAEPLPNWKAIMDQYLIDNPTETVVEAYEAYRTAFCARVSNDSTDQDAIRKICVRGNKPEAETNKIRICGGKYAYPPKKHSLPYIIDDTGDVSYEALRQLECNGIYYVAYADSKYLYGDQEEGSSINTTVNWNHIIPESFEELQSFNGLMEWESQFHPARIEVPTC